MSKVHKLRTFEKVQLNAMFEEIIGKCEEELSSSQNKDQRRKGTLDEVLHPKVLLYRLNPGEGRNHDSKDASSVKDETEIEVEVIQGSPESPEVKMEPEEELIVDIMGSPSMKEEKNEENISQKLRRRRSGELLSTISSSDTDDELESDLSDDEEDYPQENFPVEESVFREETPPLGYRSQSPNFFSSNVEEKTSHLTPPSPPSPQTSSTSSPSTPKRRGKSRVRSRGRCRRSLTPDSRSRSPIPGSPEQDEDTAPLLKRFKPEREPGLQLNRNKSYSFLDLFSLFIDRSAIMTICSNTNKQAAKNIAKGKKYNWSGLQQGEFYKFVGLVFYMELIRLKSVADYWTKNTIFSQCLPARVMTRERYKTISCNIHLSDPDEDVVNDQRKGTPQYDKLFRLRPLLNSITGACKAQYHPRQNVTIVERMVASNGISDKEKGFKLFVLADGESGYTVDFNICTGKSEFSADQELSYNAVMDLMNQDYLGSGYTFVTSHRLFSDLEAVGIEASDTFRGKRKGPRCTMAKTPEKKDQRSTLKWIEDGYIAFVKNKDSKQVADCSTIRPASIGDTVSRMRITDYKWAIQYLPCPNPLFTNQKMGGSDQSDQFVQYYSGDRRHTMLWYRTLFYHFLDIAATNAYILHQELCKVNKQKAMTHKSFMQVLVSELVGMPIHFQPTRSHGDHLPVIIKVAKDPKRKKSTGRKICYLCKQFGMNKLSTPWKCQACDVPLCLIPDRNCFHSWHQ